MAFIAAALILVLFLVFRLGSQASAGVTLNDPVVWVEDGARGRVLQINGVTEEITAAVRVGDRGDELSVLPRGRDAVFLNKTLGEIGVIGASSLDIESQESLVGEGEPALGPDVELLADFELARQGFVVAEDRLLVVEPGAGAPVEIATGDGLGDRVIDPDGQLAALTADASQVGVTNSVGQFVSLAPLPDPLEQNAEQPGLARSGDGTFIVDAGRRAVNEILSDGTLGPTTCVAGSLSGVKVAGNRISASEGTSRILVHDTASGILSVSLPETGECLQIPLPMQSSPDDWGDPVAVDEVAYLPNYATSRIVVVDLEERSVLDEVRFGVAGRPFELEVFQGAVWANEPQGALAAVFHGDEISVISKISTLQLGSGENGEGDGVESAQTDDGGGEVIFGQQGDFGLGNGGIAVGEGGDGAGAPDEDGDFEEAGDDLDVPFDGELSNAPVILDAEEPAPTEEEETIAELDANFVFSTDTLNVGETVELTDTSTGDPTSWNWDFGDGTGDGGPEVEKIWDSEGVFTVTLFVSDDAGNQDSQSFDFTVIAPDLLRVPTADFSFRSDTIEVGESLQFVDQSTGNPDLLLWSFGDGSTDTGSVVSHSFDVPGQFAVSLTASNEAGPNTTSATITVVEAVSPPEAVIAAFPTIVEVGQTVTLTSQSTNSPTTVSWEFGDGQAGLGTTVRHRWATPGEFRIRLTVSNSAGSDTVFSDLTVLPAVDPPIARFGQSDLEVIVGEEIRFNDLSLNNPDELTWEFGDNTTDQGANVSKSWSSPGTFTVTLTATNDAGSDSTAKTVTVLPLPPTPPNADFTIPTAVIPVNEPLSFTDTSTGDPTEWLWNFGDGGSSSIVQNPVRPFRAPGTYTVMLTASNAGGSSTLTRTVTVVDPPVASFTFADDELEVSFNDTSTNNPTEWEWTFGDGSSSPAQNPVKTYALPGTYTVTLTTTNEGGTSAAFVQTVTVARAPIAGFSFTTGGLTATFTDASTQAPTSFLWDFDDGTTSNVRNPNHLFEDPGTYQVQLTVTNGSGSDSVTRPVTVVNAPPVAAFTCSQAVGQDLVTCDGTSSTGAASFAWSAPAAGPGTTPGPNASFLFPQSGTFPVTLTVTAADGQTNSTTQQVAVNIALPPPVVSVASSLNGNTISATASADQPISTWSWTISGNGSIASGGATATPTFNAPDPGTTYVIEATGLNGNGSDSATSSETTAALPAPVVTVTSSLSGNTISASASATQAVTWSWTITGSNGSILSQQTASSTSSMATFDAPDPSETYTVTANGSNGNGSDSDSDSQTTAAATPAPVVDVTAISATDTTVSASAAVTNGQSVTFSWTLSSGGAVVQTSTAANPTFTGLTPGTAYVATVTGSNGNGMSADSASITTDSAVTPPPVVDVTAISATDTTVSASAAVTNGQSVTFSWTLSSGGAVVQTSTAANPTFTGLTPGTAYVATVTGSNGNGMGTDSASVSTQAPPPPPPMPPVVSNVVVVSNVGGVVTLAATASNPPILSWSWNVSSPGVTPASSSLASPTFTVTANGTYSGTVTATNGDGPSAAVPFSFTVTDLP